MAATSPSPHTTHPESEEKEKKKTKKSYRPAPVFLLTQAMPSRTCEKIVFFAVDGAAAADATPFRLCSH